MGVTIQHSLLWVAVHLEKLPWELEGAKGCMCMVPSFSMSPLTPPCLLPVTIHGRWWSLSATFPGMMRQRSSQEAPTALAKTSNSSSFSLGTHQILICTLVIHKLNQTEHSSLSSSDPLARGVMCLYGKFWAKCSLCGLPEGVGFVQSVLFSCNF